LDGRRFACPESNADGNCEKQIRGGGLKELKGNGSDRANGCEQGEKEAEGAMTVGERREGCE